MYCNKYIWQYYIHCIICELNTCYELFAINYFVGIYSFVVHNFQTNSGRELFYFSVRLYFYDSNGTVSSGD